MGLDTYAYHKNAEGKPERMPDHLFEGVGSLCGGIFSGGGSSFRGKVYAGFLHNTVGLDLYQEQIPNSKIGEAVDRLDRWIAHNDHSFSDISRDEILALRQWFNTVYKSGGYVVGWW